MRGAISDMASISLSSRVSMPETTPQPAGFTLADYLAYVFKREKTKQLQQMHDFKVAVDTLALTMDAEGRGESITGRVAIAWTVRNRQLGKGPFVDSGKTVPEICLRRLQYSCWFEAGGKSNYERTMRMAHHVATGTDDAVGHFPAVAYSRFQESRYLAQGVLQGRLLDPTGGAAHYMTEALYGSMARPSWAAKATSTRVIDSHVFLGGIR